jgi:hypothetical protein
VTYPPVCTDGASLIRQALAAKTRQGPGTPFSSWTPVMELEPRSGNEILDGARDPHLVGTGQPRNPGSGVDGMSALAQRLSWGRTTPALSARTVLTGG